MDRYDDRENVGSSTRAVMKLTDTERRILDLLKENPAATQNELAAEIGLSNSGVRYAMARLKEKGLIDRIGSHRNGGWRLNILEKR
ncbi:MAG: winged helix-turn-helix domain-containing protein [Firmicutes bacterium]|jgi:ATP-dependent DNA helicase RecG|nr:winged helix-turn-helix domain-containing protein [Bacillota bacterium]NBI63985.1 winged helix-turn-helix domain-containing protein [Clostridiales bacterium]